MDNYRIEKCRLCEKLIKRYAFAVYAGDPSCCTSCNDKVKDGEEYSPLDKYPKYK